MDNLTHTLAGFALAESGLKRTTRLGTVTLVLAANLPDLDGLSYLLGGAGDGLAFRRGWTHGVLAMVLLPPLLTAALLGWNRLLRRREEVRGGRLLVLAAIGVASHPLLDLLNTYGVRLLMPFSPRWFYGDALFIVDPWLWVTLGAGVLLSRRRGRLNGERPDAARPARIALLLCAGYAVCMAAASRTGAAVVERQTRTGPARRTLASPVFLNPFRRRVIREFDDDYELGRLSLGWPSRYTALARRASGRAEPAARLAAATRDGRRFLRRARFPSFALESRGNRAEVMISDLRYGDGINRSWASVTVRIP